MPLPTTYQEFIALSRYSRYQTDLGRRETWDESVDRLMDFWKQRLSLDDETVSGIATQVKETNVMPSMRTLMTAGKALERDLTAAYNCAYLTIAGSGEAVQLWDSKLADLGFDEPIEIKVRFPVAFDVVMYTLLCGTGVGFSVERQYVNTLPTVGKRLSRSICKPTQKNYPRVPKEEVATLDKKHNTIRVPDSKYGWASGLRVLIVELYNGNFDVKWDLSNIRPAGTPLKTFGGRASGPEPLDKAFTFARDLFASASGRKLTSVECHDLVCKIADSVVVGGVRRSALISLSNLSDDRMRKAKSGEWWNTDPQRALANNSAVYTERPDAGTFMREWNSLYDSKSGERGIFNRSAARNLCEKIGRDPNHDWGTNPCCFTGDMRLLTSEGYRRFDELSLLDECNIVNSEGQATKGKVWSSGVKPIVEVRFEAQGGRKPILCTPDHRFMLNDGSECEAKDLKGKRLNLYAEVRDTFDKEDILAGFILGDGSLGRGMSEAHLGLEVHFGKKDGDVAEMFGQEAGSIWYSRKAMAIAEKYCLPFVSIGTRGFTGDKRLLPGLYTANGSVISGHRVALKSIDRDQLEGVAKALKSLGIESYITTNKAHTVVFSNGPYECKESYDLNISRYDSLVTFAKEISFVQGYKREALARLLKTKAPSVKNVKDAGAAEVFDFTEPETHWGIVEGFVVHNSEIILRPDQFCNLSSIIVRPDDTLESLKEKARTAATLGSWQSSLTDFAYLPPTWRKNCEEERLLGVSMTGLLDHPVLNSVSDQSREWLRAIRDAAIETNKEWAKRLGIPVSASVTCIKPEGTVSQLTNTASGLHPRYSKYYIRRVRADSKDPLAKVMQAQGFPCEKDVMQPSNLVFSFPIEAPSESIMRDDRTAIEQLEYWLMIQEEYCTHKPSVTIYVKEHEWVTVGAWVYEHFDKISGVSFLPHSDHTYQQAPYEEVDEVQYTQLLGTIPDTIDLKALADIETSDMTTGSQELACVAGQCEI